MAAAKLPDVDFTTMMTLEPHGPDTYLGVGPKYPWGGLYGGQIVAQALRAAAADVPPSFRVHSLHAYFIRRGDADEPIRFEVDRTRDGRSFLTRRVVARQAVGVILSTIVSFQVDESGPDVQMAVAPVTPPADDLAGDAWSPMFDRRFFMPEGPPGRCVAWARMSSPVGEDPVLQACALAYVSDDFPTDAVVNVQRGDNTPRLYADMDSEPFWSASLDHAIWFHRPVQVDEWHLHDFVCHGLLSSRGLAIGHVFDGGGVHVATISQEVLLRPGR